MKCAFIAFSLFFLTLSVSGNAQGQTKEEVIIRLLELDGSLNQLNNLEAVVSQQIEQQLRLTGVEITPQQLKVLQETTVETLEGVKEEVLIIGIKLYNDNFSREELEDFVAFFESEGGKTYVEKQPELIAQIMQEMMQLLGPRIPAMQEKIRRRFEELEQQEDS